VKVSINLNDDDLAFIDKETASGAYASRSVAVTAGIRKLRELAAEDSYSEAFREWEESGEGALWESTTADGLEGHEPTRVHLSL
jgi:Arc/MetJ-type ribon-helix-helix transcriptional regulator